jgi:hypothetical protein
LRRVSRRPRRGGVPLALLAAGVVALLALGAAGFLFMQMQGLKKKLADTAAVEPKGLQPEEEHSAHSEAINEEPAHKTVELGKFTANTADNRHAQMTVSLRIESFYNSADWATYEGQLEAYEHALEFYNSYQRGEVDESGKPKKKGKGGHAALDNADETSEDAGSQVLLAGYRAADGAATATELRGDLKAGVSPAGHGKRPSPRPCPSRSCCRRRSSRSSWQKSQWKCAMR